MKIYTINRNYLNKTFIIIICTFFNLSPSYSQAGSTTCEEILKKHTDYRILFNGIEYKDGDDVYICKNMLDPSKNIELIYADTKLPIDGTKWSWSECNCTASTTQNHFATINATDLIESKAKIKAKFIESRQDLLTYNKSVDLEINIKTDIEVRFKTIGNTKNYLDDNKIKYPWVSSINHPVLYIPQGEKDILKGEVKPKVAKDIIELKAYGENQNSIPLQITPNIFPIPAEDITFDLASNPITHRAVASIHSCQQDLYIITREVKQYTINVYNVCETDDDVQVNLGEVMSATDVCVSPGSDGTLDEYGSLLIGGGTLWVDKDDEVMEFNGVKHVVAGPKKVDGKFYCKTKKRANNTTCPKKIDFASVYNDIIKFYKEKANIELEFKSMPDIHMNYDSRLDDNKMEKSLEAGLDFRKLRYGKDDGRPSTTELFIVNGVIGAEAGTAAFANSNIIFVQDLKEINTSLAWAHEIGHAIFVLPHPEEAKLTDHLCWMKKNITPSDVITNHVIKFAYLRRL